MLLIATLVSNGLSLHISSAGPPRGEASHSHLQQQQMSQQSAEKRQQQTPELLQAAREAEAKERITLFDVAKGTAVGSALGEFIDPAAIDPSVLSQFF